MRISDWSSDVCSSDLSEHRLDVLAGLGDTGIGVRLAFHGDLEAVLDLLRDDVVQHADQLIPRARPEGPLANGDHRTLAETGRLEPRLRGALAGTGPPDHVLEEPTDSDPRPGRASPPAAQH